MSRDSSLVSGLRIAADANALHGAVVDPAWEDGADDLVSDIGPDRDRRGTLITLGCEVRIRTVHELTTRLPFGNEPDERERVVAIVALGNGGLYRLTPRTPLGAALLGKCVGDVVSVVIQAGTVEYEVVAVETTVCNCSDQRREEGVST